MRKLEDFFFKRRLKKMDNDIQEMIRLKKFSFENDFNEDALWHALEEFRKERKTFIITVNFTSWGKQNPPPSSCAQNSVTTCYSIIDFCLSPKLADGLIGDLSEGYRERIASGRSERYATWWCWRHGMGAVCTVWGKRLLALVGIERAIEFGRKLIGG